MQVEPVFTVISTTHNLVPPRTGIDDTRVIWRFRFEYCSGGQDPPWWESASGGAVEAPCPYIATNESERTWPLTADNGSPSTTVKRASDSQSCPSCGYFSTKVFRKMGDNTSPSSSICLNERCKTWTRTAVFFSMSACVL